MRYGLRKKFKRGIIVSAMVTFRCNLDCAYCSNKFVTGEMPKSNEMTLDGWIDKLERFPIKIKEVIITGGEPFLYKHTDDLITYLTNKGIMVAIFSNLLIRRNITYRGDLLRIEASNHLGVNQKKFYDNLDYYRSMVRVDYKKFEENKVSRGKFETENDNDCLDNPRFIIAPNGRIYINKREMLND